MLWEWKADDAAADDVLIVVSELVTNAVAAIQKHRRPNPVRLWMLGDGASILFLVWDATMPAPVRDSATPDAESKRPSRTLTSSALKIDAPARIYQLKLPAAP